MEYIHIRNLEKFNPGYADRNLIWCKIYFTMLNSNYEFDMIDDIDKWRFIALVMLELQMKKPIPYDEKWLQSKITNHKRPISLSIKMLHNFIEIVTVDGNLPYPREEKRREEKSRVRSVTPPPDFIQSLKTNKAYSHINLEQEEGKMDAWLSINRGRQKTKKFVLNWLNKIEKPLPINKSPKRESEFKAPDPKKKYAYTPPPGEAGKIVKDLADKKGT